VKKSNEERVANLLQDLRPESPALKGKNSPQALKQRMRRLSTPGVSLAVVEDCEVAYAGGFGSRQQDDASAVSSETLFQAASVSKAVFALAVVRLSKERRLDLDADVSNYLTSWHIPQNGNWTPRVTLRQLLSHTAGTTVDGFVGYPASSMLPTLSDVLNGTPPANNPPVVVNLIPGFQERYSGGGTTVAQQVVMDITGRPFPELMRELILDPLKMTRSTFEQPLPRELIPYAAVGHPWNGVAIAGGWHVYPEMAAAGLWTTAGELAHFGAEVLRILRGENSVLGLDRVAISEMLRPQLPDYRAGQAFRGLGWSCSGQGQTFQLAHQGTNEGFSSIITLMAASGQGAVVLLNSNQGASLTREIVSAIGRKYGWPVADRELKSGPMPADLSYSGTYRSVDGFAFIVTRVERGLLLHYGSQPGLPLRPVSPLKFLCDVLDLQVGFQLAGCGVIVEMTIKHTDRTIVTRKQS
jgi:CubicO group peptidase (beta-lactamase class C family)